MTPRQQIRQATILQASSAAMSPTLIPAPARPMWDVTEPSTRHATERATREATP